MVEDSTYLTVKFLKENIDFMLNLACIITDGAEYNSLADFVTMSKRGANLGWKSLKSAESFDNFQRVRGEYKRKIELSGRNEGLRRTGNH